MDWIDRLKNMKQQSGLTTKEISQQSGLPEPTLEKLFAGHTKDPKLTTIKALVHFLGYTLDDLAPAEIQNPDSTTKQRASTISQDAIEIAKAYEKADAGTQASVRKLLDIDNAVKSESKAVG